MAISEAEEKLPSLEEFLPKPTGNISFRDVFPAATEFDRERFTPTHRGRVMEGQVLGDWQIRQRDKRLKRATHRQASRLNRRIKRSAST